MSPRQGDKVSQHFVELPITDDAKCVRVQCLHCNSVKAKNTTRQKEHLRSCKPYLVAHPEAAFEVEDDDGDAIAGIGNTAPLGSGQYAPGIGIGGHGGNTNMSFAPNPRINGNPMHLPVHTADTSEPARKKHKAVKQPKQSNVGATENELPLVNIHAAYEEFKKPNDKCFTVRCKYCGQTRAKNTSRQRDHLKTCAEYIGTLPEEPTIPGSNNQPSINHVMPIQQQRPTPALTFDFRLALKFRQPLSMGTVFKGHEQYINIAGGQWSGLTGKGSVVAGTETLLTHNNSLTPGTVEVTSNVVIQTSEQPPAHIKCTIHGHKIEDGTSRVTIKMETGDVRYAMLNAGVWVAAGSSRNQEAVYDAYRVG